MDPETRLTPEQFRRLQAWRRTVVGLWLATLVGALAVWAVASAFTTSSAVEALLAAVLIALASAAAWNMRRGACPRCGEPIRFEPRIALPPSCLRCNAAFWPASDPPESPSD